LNFNHVLDKAQEIKTLHEIIELSPSALQGIGARGEESLAHLHIKTISDLGNWKYFKLARAIQNLANEGEEKGKRSPKAESNINKAVKKEHETDSLHDLLTGPITVFQGVGEQTEKAFHDLNIKTVEKLASWKYGLWAESLVELAKFENPDHSSH
jgi:nucleotidyltransferase/DNA polymerase involved in DNA repair